MRLGPKRERKRVRQTFRLPVVQREFLLEGGPRDGEVVAMEPAAVLADPKWIAQQQIGANNTDPANVIQMWVRLKLPPHLYFPIASKVTVTAYAPLSLDPVKCDVAEYRLDSRVVPYGPYRYVFERMRP